MFSPFFKKLFIIAVIITCAVVFFVLKNKKTNNSLLTQNNMVVVAENTKATPVTPLQVDENKVYTVPVLVYHTIAPILATDSAMQKRFKVSPETLEKQLIYLRDNGYTTMTFKDLATHMHAGIDVPPKTVVLTFDDGTDTQFANAFPLLQKYNATATFFIYTIVLGNKHFMTWDNVLAIDKAGMEIAGHTKTHANLPKATDQKILEDEILGSKKTIEAKIGHPIYTLAYPFYSHDERVHQLIKDAGYTAARAGWKTVPNSLSQIYAMQGIEVSDNFKLFPSYLK